MKKLNVTLIGNSPLIMHSPKCVNPLHPISIEMKKYTSKKKKTEEDLLKISDLEWESGVYWDDTALRLQSRMAQRPIVRAQIFPSIFRLIL